MTLEISVSQLSFGMRGDDVARLHKALQALGRNVPAAEQKERLLGAETVASIKALQADLGLPASGIVDAATVRHLNVELSKLATRPRVARGSVHDASGNPFSGGFVQIFRQGPTGETPLGSSAISSVDGSYKISYELPPDSSGRADLRVALLNNAGPLETIPSGASILPDAGPLEVVDFVLSGDTNRPSSEFELISGDLKPLLGNRNLADLNEDATHREVSILANQTPYSADQVADLVLAHKLEKETTKPAALFYAMLRQGLPKNALALHAANPDTRLDALKTSVDQGLVQSEINGKKIEDHLAEFVPPHTNELRGLLGSLLNADELNKFTTEYLQNSQDPAAFWTKLSTDPAWSNRVPTLEFIVQLAGLSNNHLRLIDEVRARQDFKQASDLVRLSKADWKNLIQTQGVGVPAETPGANAEEQIDNYAEQIATKVEAAFPTQFFAERLGTSTVGAFLKSQPVFDINKTYLPQFLKDVPAASQTLPSEDQRKLQSFQRIYRLTGRSEDTLALEASGIHSANQIAQIDRKEFAAQQGQNFSTTRANEIYDRAVRANAIALALWSEHGASLNRTSLQVLPKLNIQKQIEDATSSIPDWRTLFGALDFCACQECNSAHGPAAYFVDILQFLGQRGARAALFERRPDLGDIELSCENTNIVLPLIDLANEVLEDAIQPPAPFAPLTLDPSLEADLAQTVATASLTSAFTPPLRPGARVETLQAGKQWRILDEPFSYSITKETAALKVVARSRQTSGSGDERRATPQYRNSAAYEELRQAVYPKNLPFDLPFEEAKVFLAHLGVSRRELIEALRPVQSPFDPNASASVLLANEALGLTDAERKIIVGEPPLLPPEAFWGGASATELDSVQKVLDRSGLSYAELEALIRTWFINPGNSLIISVKANEPIDTCDTAKIEIEGLNADVLNRIHRFIRLWRTLGWTVPEVDRALQALAPDANTPALTNETLVRLDHLRKISSQLKLSVRQALVFWRPIDTREPGSLYRSLFYNPAVFKPQDEDFRLRPDGQELARLDKQLAEHAPNLQAIFRLNFANFELLLARTDGALTLSNLSLLYRHATFARQLGLSVTDLLTAMDLTGIDPFRIDRSQDTLQFIEIVKAIRSAGFGFPQLDYLLRHRFSPASAFVPADPMLAQSLTDVRNGLLQVDADSEAERQALEQSAIMDRLAAALGMAADLTGGLLARVTHEGAPALQRFAELREIAEPLTRDNARSQFETLEKLLKIASIIETLKIPASQLEWLFRENAWLAVAPDPPAAPVPLATWSTLIQLQQLRQELVLEDAAFEAILSAANSVAVASDPQTQVDARKALVSTLSIWLGWPAETVESLLGHSEDANDFGLLGAHIPDAYRGVDVLIRAARAIKLLKRLGVTAAQASQWCEVAVTDENAKEIRSAAKAKYDEEAWQKLAIPLQNALRDQQREALVSYLVARPEKWAPGLTKATPSDLFSHFLIDVENTSCQLTSRIKQALASVQLFAQRCLMGLEPGVQTKDEKWTQWTWMKNYRVWEANRKIWLYPENWIEPALRDDKTPFFTDLESELLQSDLDNAAAEQALFHYLEKLDEVARLELAGLYEDDESKVLHVFGRTLHAPHVYYYRRKEGITQSWTPWVKLDLDIEGDHIIPMVWNRKVLLIWPVFAEKSKQKPVVMPSPGQTMEGADRYWEIRLAWSEYQHGRWSGKNLSDPVTFAAYQGENNVLFDEGVGAPQNSAVLARMKDDNGEPPDLPGEDPEPDPVPPSPPGSTGPRRLVDKELFVFKGLLRGDTLAVRGYLRRDYREGHVAKDSEIAYPFGEFRFFGCRKIITTAHNSQIAQRNHALAPTGTKFDHMWFTQTASGFRMFDGTFPALPPFIQPTVFENVNEPASIAGDPNPTLVNKYDISVLNQTPWPFRLLPPHQDLQFVGDRPFFFMDAKRTFLVTSTGSTGKRVRPELGDWVRGDLAVAWRADYFPPSTRTPQGNGGAAGSASEDSPALTLLVRGPAGRRIAKKMAPLNLTPAPTPRSLLWVFWTTRQYLFANFHHPYLCDFVKTLDRRGIPALLSLETQNFGDAESFAAYQPHERVMKEYPIDEVEFHSGGAYELYNWELFFHIPLMIADQLSKNQRFEEAQRWFHFIFDPTGTSEEAIPQRYWRTKPFHDRLSGDYEAQSVKSIEEMIANGPPEELKVAVEIWRSNPFNPHALARLRTTAYQKTVVMKYVDNLIAWGDQRFRLDTLESINEATQLYVLAAEILGPRPEVIERNVKPTAETFNSLEPKLGALGNAMEQIELLVADSGEGGPTEESPEAPNLPSNQALYFCVPENYNLLAYWNTVSDRLFKIRHCMNIEGQVRQLPLFEPPIDPALLVRARAAGLSIGQVLSDMSASLPNYRFSVMLQKATEMVSEVRNLGMAMLSAMEKRDAEVLSALRSDQELRLLQAVRDVRVSQVNEAKTNVEALQASREITEARQGYYATREFLNPRESKSRDRLELSLKSLELGSSLRGLAAVLGNLGVIKLGSPTTAGTELGPSWTAWSMLASASALEVVSSILSVNSQLAGRMGEFDRRKDDWDLQVDLATRELKQIDKQLIAAQIRLAIAEQELNNHDRQVDNARDVDQFLRSKFTSQDLYQWMIGQVSGLYFQNYQLAYDLAKRAEHCMQHELGLKYGETSVIRFGYWDSLKKGLMAGDHLAYDLKRLDVAYLDGNIREFELTKHVSLVSLTPEQLIALKETGACEFDIPEWLFDLDTPGHYRRRLKMLSLTVPCVTGPYTTIHLKAQLLMSTYRQDADLAGGYDRRPPDDPSGPDGRFVDDRKILESMVTSTGQNDAGLFEPALRDERYLPFEGAGVVSRWRLELPTEFKSFDYRTISDVILHLRYTARDGGDPLRAAAGASVSSLLSDATTRPLLRLFSLRHEFPGEWHRFVTSPPSAMATIMVDLAATRFPYFTQGRNIVIQQAHTIAIAKSGAPPSLTIAPGQNPPDLSKTAWTDPESPGPWTIATTSDPKSLEDVFVILAYTV